MQLSPRSFDRRREREHPGSRRRAGVLPLIISVLMGLALASAGCSDSSDEATETSASTTAQSLGSTTTAPAAATALSGPWSGEFQQTAPSSASGTFTLTWQQSGTNLSGTITVAGSSGFTSSITGSLEGSSIRFGTVGQGTFSYTGSVSGNTLSGTYQDATGTARGTWRATKTS